MAFFPAEVLVSPYRTLGDVREILVIASIPNDVLIFTVAAMLFLALASLRRRRYAACEPPRHHPGAADLPQPGGREPARRLNFRRSSRLPTAGNEQHQRACER